MVMQTATMMWSLLSRADLFLVSFSYPGTKLFTGPNRSTIVTKKGGAIMSCSWATGPIGTSTYFFLFMWHLMHSSASSLYSHTLDYADMLQGKPVVGFYPLVSANCPVNVLGNTVTDRGKSVQDWDVDLDTKRT